MQERKKERKKERNYSYIQVRMSCFVLMRYNSRIELCVSDIAHITVCGMHIISIITLIVL